MTEWKKILKELKAKKAINYSDYPDLSEVEKQLIEELLQNDTIESSLELLESVDNDKEWTSLKQKLHLPKEEAKLFTLSARAGKFLLKYAAVLTIPFLLTPIYFYLKSSPYFSKPLTEYDFPSTASASGKLILADGSEITLEELRNNSASNSFKLLDGKNLDYSAAQPTDEIEYNTLIVPKGSEYRLTLSDGSQIHLNSDSKIKYPTHFNNSGDREIFLEKGEAFFDIARKEDQPFTVNVQGLQVSVLGTSFNVNSYEESIYTTLIEGKITVSNHDESFFIEPDHQAVYNKKDKQIRVNRVNTAPVIGWHYNQWVFEDAPLDEIMTSLSRWYDYEIVFVDESARALRFAAKIEKYSNIEEVLSLLEKTDKIHFTAKERRIFIHKNK